MSTAYDFVFTQFNGKELPLADFRGKVIVIVNTASECGFTKQYKGLQALHEAYQNRGLVLIGVPSNDFGGQEPGSDEAIQSFCQLHYGVSFTVVKKEKVSGAGAHPFYVWAKKTLGFGTAPKWNFHKYLIDRQGNLVDYFNSTTDPEAPRVKAAIEKLLDSDS